MKNILRILTAFFLLVFASGTVLYASTGKADAFMVTQFDTTRSDDRSAIPDIIPDMPTSKVGHCGDCAHRAEAIPACHFLCAIVAMPDIAMLGDGLLPGGLLTVLPAMDRATGLSPAPDLSPPRMLS